MSAPAASDFILVGGGVIGLSIAWELAGQGVRVTLLEQGDFGREASWAGAGMLPPGHLAKAVTPEAKLRSLSASLWPEWSATLAEQTGIDNGYRRSGGLRIARNAPKGLHREFDEWQAEGIAVHRLSGAELRDAEPALDERFSVALLLPDVCQVRNPRHLKALIAGCAARGVTMKCGEPVVGFERQGDRVTGVRTTAGDYSAAKICLTSGAWTGHLARTLGIEAAVAPVRGQIVLLATPRLPFTRVIEWGSRYLVPRPDGRILVGSTEERVGFDRRTTAAGVGELIGLAQEVVPALAIAQVERTWAGLRPGSPDGLPFLGRVEGFDNLFIAAGHFRNGLQMSPGTAVLMRQLLLDQPTDIALDAYAVSRASAG